MVIEDGGVVQAAIDGILGNERGAIGSIRISGSSTRGANLNFGGGSLHHNLLIGNAGRGFVEVEAGARVALTGFGQVHLGSAPGSYGSLAVRGDGSFWGGMNLDVGFSSQGVLEVSDGARLQLSDRISFSAIRVATNLDGSGTINIGEGGAPGLLDVSAVHGGEGDATLNFNHNASAHRFENSEGNPVLITGSTKVNHLGSGTTVLGGENTYTGDTTISNGTLRVNGSAANSSFTVDSGGTLGGFGTVGKLSLGSGGFLSPGESAGSVHVAGDFSWTAGGVVVFELGPDAAGSDFIEVAGEFLKDGDGGWAFDFVATNWIVGHTYDLAEFLQTDFEVGDFSFRNPGPFDGDFALEENRLQFTLTEVPEPSAYGLLIGFTAGALLLFRRKRRGRLKAAA